MFDHIFPQRIDNNYRGHKVALWIFGLIIALKILMSLNTIFNGYSVLSSADGVPIDTFPAAASQIMVSLGAIWGYAHLVLCFLLIVVLIRYRSAVPLMFTLLLVEQVGRRLILYTMPIATGGTAPGFYVNIVLIAMIFLGLALSLLHRGKSKEPAVVRSASPAVNKS